MSVARCKPGFMTIEASSTVDRPSSEVWKLLVDPSAWPRWNPVYLELSQTSAGPIQVGARFHSKHPQNRTLDETIVSFEPNRKFAFEFTSGPIRGSREIYILEELPASGGKTSTRLTRQFEVRFGGIFKMLGPLLITPSFKREKRVEVDTVKRLLEQSASPSSLA